MLQSGLGTETPFKRLYGKEANLSHLKTIGARAFVHIKDAKKLEPKPWEGMLCDFNEDEALSYWVWNPKPRRVVESRNVTFIETPPHLIPQPTRLSSLRELPPAELVDDYASTDDMLRDAWDYTTVLDFNVDIPDEHANADSVDGDPGMEPILEHTRDVTRKDLLIPPGEVSSGGASSVDTFPGEHCRRHHRLLLHRTRCRRAVRQRSGSASALSGALSGTIRSSCASYRTSGATQRTCAYASASGKCTAAPTNTQWHRQPGDTFRATYTAQLALARSLHRRRDAGY